MLAHFLDNRMVLNYRNGGDWYDVHPLLREVVDNYDPPPDWFDADGHSSYCATWNGSQKAFRCCLCLPMPCLRNGWRTG